ncbi:hypothetical protein AncyloWKF20_21120 [Ancylobacter sp. WKF20]|uniref:hypothetical protein n=1 Tax=Ancylobacter sp. WKF20 TaxID=3039801 RepID=UPI0024341D0E|nr:hypothetical protein [Ancylobacter sp. WKF20]WGD30219.1 hypothetical protein AncyloWKF20_21120 [Ancylobacter sp. WKF20]
MITLKHALGGAAIGAMLVLPVMAQDTTASADIGRHDGIWQVATVPATGPCSKRMEFKLAVEDGQISYGGMIPVAEASGSVNPLGAIVIRVVRGDETVDATGLVRGDTASGQWVSPVKNCTGSWVARKA